MDLLEQINNVAAEHKILLIFFDIGEVLVSLDFEQKKQKTMRYLQTDMVGYKQFFDAAISDYFLGKIDHIQFDHIAQQMFGITTSLAQVRTADTKQQWQLNTEVVDLLPTLASLYKLSSV